MAAISMLEISNILIGLSRLSQYHVSQSMLLTLDVAMQLEFAHQYKMHQHSPTIRLQSVVSKF